MATDRSRMAKAWADVDEDSDDGSAKAGAADEPGAKFETKADEHGIKMVIEYKEKDGKTYKVSRKVKQTIISFRTNQFMEERKLIPKFGKAVTNDAREEEMHCKQQEDEIGIDLVKKIVTLAAKDEAEDKFLDEAFAAIDGLFKEKKAWTDINRDRQVDRDSGGAPRPDESVAAQLDPKPGESAPGHGPPKPGAYIPPSMRGKDGGKGDGKGGKGLQEQQEASLRVTNLSETAKEGDLQMLFGQYGRLQRVYIAKDRETFQSRGFAFVTYYNKEDGERAIKKLHGHGYDNLIMQVQWAKPRV